MTIDEIYLFILCICGVLFTFMVIHFVTMEFYVCWVGRFYKVKIEKDTFMKICKDGDVIVYHCRPVTKYFVSRDGKNYTCALDATEWVNPCRSVEEVHAKFLSGTYDNFLEEKLMP